MNSKMIIRWCALTAPYIYDKLSTKTTKFSFPTTARTGMKICYFGTYDRHRPRNRVMIEGLRRNGVDVVECHYDLWKGIEDKSRVRSWLRALALLLSACVGYLLLVPKYLFSGQHDAVIVGYLGHFDMFIARPLAAIRRKPLYFNAFLSLYDTVVCDRKILSEKNPLAKILFLIDHLSLRLADGVLLDTEAHIGYFVETFGSKREKFERVFVGADERVFRPRQGSPEKESKKTPLFRVLFYGQYIPLQGAAYIIRAAKLLAKEDGIQFTLIGTGQEYAAVRAMASGIPASALSWLEWIHYETLPEYIHASDVCLGIFGDTPKARRVIPNKAFQVIACGRPLVTGRSPASQELFTDRKDALLCEMANAEALAGALLLLKNNRPLSDSIAENGYKLFMERCSSEAVGGMTRAAIGRWQVRKG